MRMLLRSESEVGGCEVNSQNPPVNVWRVVAG
jgi:hypothetical protein